MKVPSLVLVAAASAALVLVGVSPANAVGNDIDPGDNLYAVNCDDEAYPAFQLLHVDPTTAVSTTIGSGAADDGDYNCALQPAYNPVTGVSYYIQYVEQGAAERQSDESNDEFQTEAIIDDGEHYSLATIDPATGVSTYIGEFFWNDGEDDVPIDVTSIAIGTDGAALAFSYEGETSTLWSLDLSSGELTHIDDGYPASILAFAVDPTTGIFWFVSENEESDDLYQLDPVSYVDDYETSFEIDGYVGVHSLQIDEGGTFWIQVDNDEEFGAGLFSFTLATEGSPVFSGDFTDDPYYTEALLIIPGDAPPQLAATGIDTTPVVFGAGLLALLGTGLLLATRRRATRVGTP